jgi:hypothetical protein
LHTSNHISIQCALGHREDGSAEDLFGKQLRAVNAVPANDRSGSGWPRHEIWSEDALYRYSSLVLGRPLPPSPSPLVRRGLVTSIGVMSIDVTTWAGDIAFLLAEALGLGFTSTRILSDLERKLRKGGGVSDDSRTESNAEILRLRSEILFELLEQPPDRFVYQHSLQLRGDTDHFAEMLLSGTVPVGSLFVYTRESDELLEWSAKRSPIVAKRKEATLEELLEERIRRRDRRDEATSDHPSVLTVPIDLPAPLAEAEAEGRTLSVDERRVLLFERSFAAAAFVVEQLIGRGLLKSGVSGAQNLEEGDLKRWMLQSKDR